MSKKKRKTKNKIITKWLKENRHMILTELIEKLNKKLIEMYAYYGINGVLKELYKTYYYIKYELYNVVIGRSQRRMKPSKYMRILERIPIAKPKIYQDIWCWVI